MKRENRSKIRPRPDFNNLKKTFLSKLDKSNAGGVDGGVRETVNLINSHSEYFTTSSCAGRVYLWKEPKSRKKKDVELIFLKHGKLNTTDIRKIKQLILPKETVWLRVEPIILHVCCRELDAAQRFLDIAKRLFKKSCFLSIKNKIILEVRGSEIMEVPLAEKKKWLVSEEYFDCVIKKANERYSRIEKKNNEFLRLLNEDL